MTPAIDTDRTRLEAFAQTFAAAARDLVDEAVMVRDQHAARLDALATETTDLGVTQQALRLALVRETTADAQVKALAVELAASKVEVTTLADRCEKLRRLREEAEHLRDEAVDQMLSARAERDAATAAKTETVPVPVVDLQVLSLQDIRQVLLDEANEDTGVVRGLLEWSDDDESEPAIVDSIVSLCTEVRHAREREATAAATLERICAAAGAALDEKPADAVAAVGNLLQRLSEVQAELAARVPVGTGAAAPITAPSGTESTDIDDGQLWVMCRTNVRPVVRRVFLRDGGAGWTPNLAEARRFDAPDVAHSLKPNGALVVRVCEVPGLPAPGSQSSKSAVPDVEAPTPPAKVVVTVSDPYAACMVRRVTVGRDE